MSGVSAIVSVHLSATYSEAPPLGSAQQIVNENPLLNLNPGTGAGNSDTMFTKSINIAASGNTTIDLTGSALDVFGATVAFAFVQMVLIEADSGNVNNIVVGNGTNPWLWDFDAGTDTESVKPGGMLLKADKTGWPVTAATADILKIANSGSGTAVVGKITIIGRSA